MADEVGCAALMALLVGCAGQTPAMLEPVELLEGTLVWDVEFEDGERCSYARSYEAIEDRSAPWLCPECDIIWRADVVDVEGEDCFAKVSSLDTAPSLEWLGRSEDTFFRATMLNTRLTAIGSAVDDDENTFSVEHTTEVDADEGLATLHITGALDGALTIGDPYHGWRPPPSYACGWSKVEAPPYEGDWVLTTGKTVPDGWFLDRCDEPVRLHELAGRYIVIDLSASDCAPCQDMAVGERAFVDDMAASGVPVEVVTLMVPSLGALLTPAPQSLLDDWSTQFGLDSPVLADRGWGLFVAGAAIGGLGYPTSIVVGPNLNVLDVSVGFGSWDYHRELIIDHAR